MDILNVVEAANYSGLSKSSLDKRRVYGGGPLFATVKRDTDRQRTFNEQEMRAWRARS
jgi:hypothetical protein